MHTFFIFYMFMWLRNINGRFNLLWYLIRKLHCQITMGTQTKLYQHSDCPLVVETLHISILHKHLHFPTHYVH